jgi:predicted patatin/cPLA2 family phospholipase
MQKRKRNKSATTTLDPKWEMPVERGPNDGRGERLRDRARWRNPAASARMNFAFEIPPVTMTQTLTSAPLSHSSSVRSVNTDTALVVQGGGLRGAYAAGVLRSLHAHYGHNPFSTIVSVSSSVFATSYFLTGQVEEMEDTWRNHVHGNRLINYSRFFRGKSVLGLDYLIDLFQGPVRLDVERLLRSRHRLYYVLTDYATGCPQYYDARCPDIFDLMRASSALPYLYRIPVNIDGRSYYDGGHSDPIPLEYALTLGYKRILVILTCPLSLRMTAASRALAYFLLPGSAGAREKLRKVHERHNRALDLIRNPPPGVQIQVIAPSVIHSSRLTRSRVSIIGAIESGKRDAADYLARHRRVAAPQTCLR